VNLIEILKVPPGATQRKKRVGRGPSSGHGKTCTRGTKGQKARGSGKIPPWFEGGQMPLTRRIPKRGFSAFRKKEYEIVNVGELNVFEAGTLVDPEVLKKRGFIKKTSFVKILGKGTLNKPLHVKAHSFSKSAESKISQAGGKVEVIKC